MTKKRRKHKLHVGYRITVGGKQSVQIWRTKEKAKKSRKFKQLEKEGLRPKLKKSKVYYAEYFTG